MAMENALASTQSAQGGHTGNFVALQVSLNVNGMGQRRFATIPVAPREHIKLARIFKGMVIILAWKAAGYIAVATTFNPREMVPKHLLLLHQCVLQWLLEKLVISSPFSHLTNYSNVHASQVSCYSLAYMEPTDMLSKNL
jgi:hypothetical protein